MFHKLVLPVQLNSTTQKSPAGKAMLKLADAKLYENKVTAKMLRLFRSGKLIGYPPDISSFKRDITFAPSATGSAFLSMQIDIWPQVVGKTN